MLANNFPSALNFEWKPWQSAQQLMACICRCLQRAWCNQRVVQDQTTPCQSHSRASDEQTLRDFNAFPWDNSAHGVRKTGDVPSSSTSFLLGIQSTLLKRHVQTSEIFDCDLPEFLTRTACQPQQIQRLRTAKTSMEPEPENRISKAADSLHALLHRQASLSSQGISLAVPSQPWWPSLWDVLQSEGASTSTCSYYFQCHDGRWRSQTLSWILKSHPSGASTNPLFNFWVIEFWGTHLVLLFTCDAPACCKGMVMHVWVFEEHIAPLDSEECHQETKQVHVWDAITCNGWICQ